MISESLTSLSIIKFGDLKKKPHGKTRFNPLNSFEIERIKERYLNDPKLIGKKNDNIFVLSKMQNQKINNYQDFFLPRLDQFKKSYSKNFAYDSFNSFLNDFGRHSLSSFSDSKRKMDDRFQKVQPLYDSSDSNTSTPNEIMFDRSLSVENLSTSLKTKLKDQSFLYKLDDTIKIQNQNEDVKTQFRLKPLPGNHELKPEKSEQGAKSKTRKKIEAKKTKLKKIVRNESKHDEKTKVSDVMNEIEPIRVDSPHMLKKSVPDDYKFVSHSSIVLGVTSKELAHQFKSFESNHFTNDKRNSD